MRTRSRRLRVTVAGLLVTLPGALISPAQASANPLSDPSSDPMSIEVARHNYMLALCPLVFPRRSFEAATHAADPAHLGEARGAARDLRFALAQADSRFGPMPGDWPTHHPDTVRDIVPLKRLLTRAHRHLRGAATATTVGAFQRSARAASRDLASTAPLVVVLNHKLGLPYRQTKKNCDNTGLD